ncbi:hypothetical protein [Paenibacillus sanguinis]|uniref:DUF6848 family protein n=1 Tax=Paenibacillus sanguinis TaxID=225906 RepID=UPI0003752386|nr:hypothetical protein [Paenibacillus sanguinis]
MSNPKEASKVEEYKSKYGKVYQVKATIEPDDATTVDLEYCFKRPATASYDRYVKGTAQSPTKALKNFILDNIVEEQAAKLEADLEEYPALSLAIGEKLLAMLGLSKDVNLKQL